MVAPEKLGRLFTACIRAIRVMQREADTFRGLGLTAQAAVLEDAVTGLAEASHNIESHEELAKLLAVTGRTVRAMQAAAVTLRESGEDAEPMKEKALALSNALHGASADTVPISLDDVLKDD